MDTKEEIAVAAVVAEEEEEEEVDVVGVAETAIGSALIRGEFLSLCFTIIFSFVFTHFF